MDQTRREFIQNSIVLAGTAGLVVSGTDAIAANTEATTGSPVGMPDILSTSGSDKVKDLIAVTAADNVPLTTNVGMPISTDQNSLRAGERGPALLEDFVLREKLQHFDHERYLNV